MRCRLGLHDFQWPPHTVPDHWEKWRDLYFECARGCGTRTVRRCRPEDHWRDRHPEGAPDA